MVEKINPQVFLTVAETGSFRQAAERLGYTQAGISYIIAAMEEAIGLRLFTREHGGVRLTQDGRELLPQIRQLSEWERHFRQTIDEISGLEKGLIRVQIFDSISVHWIPGIVQHFHHDYPGIEIELISEEDSQRAAQMLENGEVDCGFFLSDLTSRLDVFPLLKDPLIAVVGPDHMLADQDRFPLADLGRYPFIAMKYDDHTGVKKLFEHRNIIPDTAFYMDNDYAAMAMVSRGLGYGIFPKLLLRNVPYKLHFLPFDEPQYRTICIGTRSFKNCSRACAKFIEYVREWVQQTQQTSDH